MALDVRKMLFCCALFLLGSRLQAQQLVGYWIGSLPAKTPKNAARRMVLQANRGREQRAVLYSIDQDREPWTPDSVILAQGHLNLELDKGRARFSGVVSADGKKITGTWNENGLPARPLVFTQEPKDAAWRLVQPSSKDSQIVTKARDLLKSPDQWDRHDTDGHKCDPTGKTFTLYCAFEIATKQVSGTFEHRDTALEEARFVIESRGKQYPHRLLGYNNDPEITFEILQELFDQVSQRVRMDGADAQAADEALPTK